ncbi:MAG TPA: TetR/AcrR family transcriptional regulator [Polyangia bacterium]|nr:TetR/AcrR family transcriptional regulator [Polyangia bacterium]
MTTTERVARPHLKKAYHHGNVRRELVAAALEIINRSGPQALTLRAAAKRLGVTAAAPYRHFANKKALLAAVATEGFTTLLAECRAATDEAGTDPLARYEAMAVGYVRFGTAHPGHFGVMYGPQVDFGDVAVPERRAALRMLTDAVEACQAAGIARAGSSRDVANQAWAYAHGLITLYLHGLLHRSIDVPALIELARDIRVFLRQPQPDLGRRPRRSSKLAPPRRSR